MVVDLSPFWCSASLQLFVPHWATYKNRLDAVLGVDWIVFRHKPIRKSLFHSCCFRLRLCLVHALNPTDASQTKPCHDVKSPTAYCLKPFSHGPYKERHGSQLMRRVTQLVPQVRIFLLVGLPVIVCLVICNTAFSLALKHSQNLAEERFLAGWKGLDQRKRERQ